MSTTSKTVLGIVITVIVIGGGIWWWMASQQNNPNIPMAASPSATSTSTASATAPQGDSDQAIGQDMTSADAQMNGFSSDSASMNQSMNDQPVQQGQ